MEREASEERGEEAAKMKAGKAGPTTGTRLGRDSESAGTCSFKDVWDHLLRVRGLGSLRREKMGKGHTRE